MENVRVPNVAQIDCIRLIIFRIELNVCVYLYMTHPFVMLPPFQRNVG